VTGVLAEDLHCPIPAACATSDSGIHIQVTLHEQHFLISTPLMFKLEPLCGGGKIPAIVDISNVTATKVLDERRGREFGAVSRPRSGDEASPH
jgi:hypothetical protein